MAGRSGWKTGQAAACGPGCTCPGWRPASSWRCLHRTWKAQNTRPVKGFDFAFEVAFEQPMPDDLSDPLYRRELLRLAANATGAGHLPVADATASVHNPACGDRVHVELALEGGRIAALAHVTHGCVLTQASAALLAGTAAGRDRADM